MVGSFIVRPGESWMWFRGYWLLGCNSDSVCYVNTFNVPLSFMTRRNGSWAAYWRQADIRRDVLSYERRPTTYGRNCILIVLLKNTILRLGFESYEVFIIRSGDRENVWWMWEEFPIYDGDGISEWCEVIICFVPKSWGISVDCSQLRSPLRAVILEFVICFLRRGGRNFLVVSFVPGKSWVTDTRDLNGPLRPSGGSAITLIWWFVLRNVWYEVQVYGLSVYLM